MTSRKILIIIVIVIVAVFFVVIFSSMQKVLKTPEGIPRKLVVRKDDTPLYFSELLRKGSQKKPPWQAFYVVADRIVRKYKPSYHNSEIIHKSFTTVKQWRIFYIFDEVGNYYLVSVDVEQLAKNPFFIKKDDVIEWNSYICLNYKNSPHETKRDLIRTYKTLEGAKTGEGEGVMIEKQKHETSFSPSDAHPILKEYENSIYYVASLYDKTDKDGNYIFSGDYGFGYVKYAENAHEFRRYVSKKQLDKQIRYVVEGRLSAKPNMNPTELDRLYGPLSDLLADFGSDVKKGVRDILRVFQSGDVPSELKNGPFDDNLLRGQDSSKIDPELTKMANTMVDYYKNDSLWNEDGYAYIPAEWMKE